MAEREFTGMYELLDALEAALKTADPAKRQALAKTSPSYSAGLEFELTGVAQSVELA